MFDQCLKILLIFGLFSAVARGEDEYASTSTSTIADNYNGKLTCPYVLFEPASHECYESDPNCDWEYDPSGDRAWYGSRLVWADMTSRFPGRIYSHEYTSTSTSTIADNYNGKLSCPYVLFEPAAHECHRYDHKCNWELDWSADQSNWRLISHYNTTRLYSYVFGSSPQGNGSIRAISPIFSRDDNYGCITNNFQMYIDKESGLVGLRVYQKPVHIALRDLIAYSDEAKKDYILFEVWGDQGDGWHTKEFPLKHFDSNFQIILEGIFGEVPVHMGIYPMQLMRRNNCTVYTPYTKPNRQTTSTTLSTTTTMSTTTTEREMQENVRGEDYDEYTTPTNTREDDDEYATKTQPTLDNYNECYESDPDCDWKNDPSADQTWYMHYYHEEWMYSYFIGSSPRGNSSARAISPIFRRVDNYSCVSIDFLVNSKSKSGIVGLRVYQKPVRIALTDLIAYSDEAKKDYILFEVWGDQGSTWHTKKFPLNHFDSNFQIIFEGIFGELPVHMVINPVALKRTTECTGYTPHTIPNRQTTSTTLSTTTTMSTTTTERAMQENGDTITEKVTKSDTRVDSRPASTLSDNPWSTTTWPTTLPIAKQQTTTQSLPEGNGCGDSRNPPIILSLIAPGNSLIDFRVRPPCSASAASGALAD